MVRIYTKKGDDGSTSLWYGGRVAKDHPRPEAYGAVDEAVSALGVARAACGEGDEELATDILTLQNELFVCGAELATDPGASERLEDGVSRVTTQMVDALDGRIDRYMERVDLPPRFTIPGGTPLSAHLDLARTLVRRAERRIVDLAERGELASGEVLRFMNRASDLVFAMARFADVDDPAMFAGREAGG